MLFGSENFIRMIEEAKKEEMSPKDEALANQVSDMLSQLNKINENGRTTTLVVADIKDILVKAEETLKNFQKDK